MAEHRYFSLRFDIDTDTCLRVGTPALLDLAREIDVSCSFFVTSGRAIAHSVILEKLLAQPTPDEQPKVSLKTRQKLGLWETVRLLSTNPPLLPRRAHIVRRAHLEAHEVGLHGGSNHALWQSRAHLWSRQHLERELDTGLNRLESSTGIRPRSFASPGWNSPAALPDLLVERGFDVLADEHGGPRAPYLSPETGIISAPTWLAGEPGGIGYLEWHRARGTSDRTLLTELRRYLDSEWPLVALYDHPFYAGRYELDLLTQIVAVARQAGRTIMPLGSAARTLVTT